MPRRHALTSPAWSRLMLDSHRLWWDAGVVIALRMGKMAAGGPVAMPEAHRMITEKVDAAFELAEAIAAGQVRNPRAFARKAHTVSGKRVRANRKRLA